MRDRRRGGRAAGMGFGGLLVLAMLLAGVGGRAGAQAVPGVRGVEARQALPTGQPGWVTRAQDMGEVAPESRVRLSLLLATTAERQAALRSRLEAQQTAGSAQFHHWMTPEEIGAEFGAPAADRARLKQWAADQGLAVVEEAPSGLFLAVEAPAGIAGRAFGTSFHQFAVARADGTPTGEVRRIAVGTASLPVSVATLVNGVVGLDEGSLLPASHVETLPMETVPALGGGSRVMRGMSGVRPQATYIGGRHVLTPGDFNYIYDAIVSLQSGASGAGERVAVVGLSRVEAQDLAAFQTLTATPLAQPRMLLAPGVVDPGATHDGLQVEATLDVERVMGTAQGAGVDLVVSSRTAGLQTAVQYAVQTLRDPVLSISFGGCETGAGQAGVAYWDTLFAQAAAEGISTFVASGDAGAACGAAGATPAAQQTRDINLLCASSYVTCVGGTEFADQDVDPNA